MQEHCDSVWGHIDDLRKTLLRTLWVIALFFVGLLSLYQPILQVLTSYSFQTELAKQRVERFEIKNQTGIDQVFHLPTHAKWVGIGEGKASILRPGESLSYDQTITAPLLIMGPIEGLILVFKACFWLSIALAAPLWGWVWLRFILPGIKAQEKAFLIPFLIFSLIFILMGCLLAYRITLPIANEYLMLFNSSIGQNAWTLNHYVNYVLFLCAGHAIAAEIAFILMVLVHFRLLSPEWLISKRRYMIVAAFILGALLTPPDVLTQLLLAFPLIGIYEIAICYAKWRRLTRRELFHSDVH